MDARFGPRDLVDDATLNALSRRSDARGLVHLSGHFMLLVATGAAVWWGRGSWWLLPALPLHAVVLDFLFAPLHETIHRTAFRSRWLNVAVSWMAGLLLLLPPNWFRAFHFAHHRWTQDPARDPELDPPRSATLRQWLWHISGIPYWIAALRGLGRRAAGLADDPFLPPKDRPVVIREARIALAVYAVVLLAATALGGLGPLVWLWLLPALIGQPALRLYLLAEHWGCDSGPDMLRNTRTTRTVAAVRFLAWNMPYHAEHHAFPGVPFHALPRVHDRIGGHLRFVADGYLATSCDIVRQLRQGRPQPSHSGNARAPAGASV